VSSGKGFTAGWFLPPRLSLVPGSRLPLSDSASMALPLLSRGRQRSPWGKGHAAVSASVCGAEPPQAVAQPGGPSSLLSQRCRTLATQGVRLKALPTHTGGFFLPHAEFKVLRNKPYPKGPDVPYGCVRETSRGLSCTFESVAESPVLHWQDNGQGRCMELDLTRVAGTCGTRLRAPRPRSAEEPFTTGLSLLLQVTCSPSSKRAMPCSLQKG